jgi:hypothetical protein
MTTDRRRVVAALLLAVLGLGFVIALLNLLGCKALQLSVVKITIENPWRPLAVAGIAGAGLFALVRGWFARFLVAASLFACLSLAILFLTTPARQQWAFSDLAIFEIHVRNAAVGQQAVGAYSQYRWSHPGPLAFYAFLPFYQWGGESQFALNGAAFAMNVLAVVLIAWIVSRSTGGWLAPFVLAGIAFYVSRVPALASSFWNPHVLVLPLAALLVTNAAISSGAVWYLPLSALLASWCVQAHVGLAIAVAACTTTTAILMGRSGLRNVPVRVVWATVIVVIVIWALPVADQLINTPGNITRVLDYFINTTMPRPAFSVSLAAFGAMAAGVLRPDFYLAIGWTFEPASWWWLLTTAVGGALLAVTVVIEWRRGQRFAASLGAACVSVLIAGVLSALGLRGPVRDYQLFWLSIVGVLSASVIVNAALRGRLPSRPNVMLAMSVVLAVVPIAISVPALNARSDPGLLVENRAVEALTRRVLDAYQSGQLGEMLVEVDPNVWDVGAGVILALEKSAVRLRVDPVLLWLYGPRFRSDGRENVILSIAGAAQHARAMQQTGRVLIAEYRGIFISARPIVPFESTLTVR